MSDANVPINAVAEEKPKLLFGAPVGTVTNTNTSFEPAPRPFGAPEVEGDDGGNDEDFSDPNFKPLVENLKKVEAKELGDDEEKIYTKRCKVYRFLTESSEWKERCIGDLNLIKNPKLGFIRVEMRMEKTQRVQINHLVLPQSNISFKANSTRLLVWAAAGDTSFTEDHTPTNVTLAAKFSDEENATAFKKAFEAAIETVKEMQSKKADKDKADKKDETEEKEEKEEKKENADEDKEDKAEKDDKKEDDKKEEEKA